MVAADLTIPTHSQWTQRMLLAGSPPDRPATRVAHHTSQAAHDTSHHAHARSVVLKAVPASLSFALTVDGSTAAAKTVTVSDSGTTAATITKVAVTGDFSQTNNCGSIAADGSCAVTVTFKPSAPGPRAGTLTVTSNASSSPRVVALSGTGIRGRTNDTMLSVAPASLTFASRRLHTASRARTVTVTNTGNAAVTVSKIAITGDFAWTSTCGTSIAAGASCEVSVRFAPIASGTRFGRLTISSNASSGPATVKLTGSGTRARPAKVNLALGKPASASGYTQTYVPSNAVDGDTSTYWESTDNAFPQWLQVDLGATKSFRRIVIDLPPLTDWATRTQTLSVLGSNDGSTFTTIVKSAGYTFNPSTGNTVTITFPAASARYVRLYFTANTDWPAGQVSELQIWTR